MQIEQITNTKRPVEHYMSIITAIEDLASVLVPTSEEDKIYRQERLEDNLERKIFSIYRRNLLKNKIPYSEVEQTEKILIQNLHNYKRLLRKLKDIGDDLQSVTVKSLAIFDAIPESQKNIVAILNFFGEQLSLLDDLYDYSQTMNDLSHSLDLMMSNNCYLGAQEIIEVREVMKRMLKELKDLNLEIGPALIKYLIATQPGQALKGIKYTLQAINKIQKAFEEYKIFRALRSDAVVYTYTNIPTIIPSNRRLMRELNPATLILLQRSMHGYNSSDIVESFNALTLEWLDFEQSFPQLTEGIEIEFKNPHSKDKELLPVYRSVLTKLQDLGFLLFYDSRGEIPLPYSRNFLGQNMALKIFDELGILADATLHFNFGFNADVTKHISKLLLINLVFRVTSLFGKNINEHGADILNQWSQKNLFEGNKASSTSFPIKIRQGGKIAEFRKIFRKWEGSEKFSNSNKLLWTLCFFLDKHIQGIDEEGKWEMFEKQSLEIFNNLLGWDVGLHLAACQEYANYTIELMRYRKDEITDFEFDKHLVTMLKAARNDPLFTAYDLDDIDLESKENPIETEEIRDKIYRSLRSTYDVPQDSEKNLHPVGMHNVLLSSIATFSEHVLEKKLKDLLENLLLT